MKMYRFTAIATFVGTLIGAGFASGREIAIYFLGTSIFTPILAGAFLGFFCYFFLELGRLNQGDIKTFLGRGNKVFDITVRISCFITACAMIAGSEESIYNLLHICGGGVITGILAMFTVYFGVDKIKASNFIIVPIIIALIVVLFVKEHNFDVGGKLKILPAFTYCTMNIITGGYFISTFSKDYTKKDNIIIGAVCGVILTFLLVMVYVIIQKNIYDSMPLMLTAKQLGMAKVGNIIMYLAIFTTLTSCLSVAAKNKKIPCLIITAASFVLSLLGFKKIVDVFYPIMGIVGAIASLFCIIKAISVKKSFIKLKKSKAIKAT